MFEPVAEPAAVPPGDSRIREPGARRFLRVLRERWLIIVIAVFAGTAAALLYVSSKKPVYQANAELLISPVTDPNLDVLGLIRSSGEPSSDTQTAALLVQRPDVAAEAARLLKSPEAPQILLGRVQATPVAGSDVLAVTATGSTPAEAARLANAFAQAAIDVRRRLLQAQLRTAIPRLQAQIDESRQSQPASATSSLFGELATLRALQGGPDPTIQLGSPADAQLSPVSPRRTLSVAAGAILGLVIGIAIALAADAFDPRLRRESQLQEVLDLPVLARVPPSSNRGRWSVVGPRMPSSLLTAHEFLAEAVGSFERSDGEHEGVIVFTGADGDAAHTIIAVNHAWLVAAAGQRVVLVDGDPRFPAVGPATNVRPSPLVKQVLGGLDPIEAALVSIKAGGGELRVFAVDGHLRHNFPIRMPTGRDMISGLLHGADALVVDAPPLTASARALVMARSADRVVVVARVGVTRLAELRELGRLFADHSVRGAGIVLVGGGGGRRSRGRGRRRESGTDRALQFRLGSGEDEPRVPGAAGAGVVQAVTDGAAQRPRRLRAGRQRVGRL